MLVITHYLSQHYRPEISESAHYLRLTELLRQAWYVFVFFSQHDDHSNSGNLFSEITLNRVCICSLFRCHVYTIISDPTVLYIDRIYNSFCYFCAIVIVLRPFLSHTIKISYFKM
jgi:hypothetical protein